MPGKNTLRFGYAVPLFLAVAASTPAFAQQPVHGAAGQPGVLDRFAATVGRRPPDPVFTITANSLNLVAGQPVTVKGVWSGKVENASYFFVWGDSSVSSQSSTPEASHSYTAPRSYTLVVNAKATVEDKQVFTRRELTVQVTAPGRSEPGGAGTWGQTYGTPSSGSPWAPTGSPGYGGHTSSPVGSGSQTPPYQTPTPTPTPAPTPAPTPTPAAQPQGSVPSPATPGSTVTPATDSPASTIPARSTLALIPDPASAAPGHAIVFHVRVQPWREIPTFRYTFGDGTSKTGPDGISHSYRNAGQYPASVSELSADTTPGQQAALPSAPVEIAISSPVSPSLRLALLTRHPVIGKALIVDATLYPPERPVDYVFDWGDGTAPETVSAVNFAEHSYASPGSYPVHVSTIADEVPVQATITLTVGRNWAPWLGLAAVLLAGAALLKFFSRPRLRAICRPGAPATTRLAMVDAPPRLTVTFRQGTGTPRTRLRMK